MPLAANIGEPPLYGFKLSEDCSQLQARPMQEVLDLFIEWIRSLDVAEQRALGATFRARAGVTGGAPLIDRRPHEKVQFGGQKVQKGTILRKWA